MDMGSLLGSIFGTILNFKLKEGRVLDFEFGAKGLGFRLYRA